MLWALSHETVALYKLHTENSEVHVEHRMAAVSVLNFFSKIE